jgi:hypothetical protein
VSPPPTSLIGYCDLIERRLDDARLAAQGQDEIRALAAIDDARLAMHQMRLMIADQRAGRDR